jgi:hypothetical protein
MKMKIIQAKNNNNSSKNIKIINKNNEEKQKQNKPTNKRTNGAKRKRKPTRTLLQALQVLCDERLRREDPVRQHVHCARHEPHATRAIVEGDGGTDDTHVEEVAEVHHLGLG